MYIAHDSLAHDDHPLHIEGVKGVELFMGRISYAFLSRIILNHIIGTFPTGESRLLFSSAQVDYIRYWLHAMKLTKAIIPLPYSDCLLTESDLRTVTPITYATGGLLKQALKVSAYIYTSVQLVTVFQTIEKNNKRLKGSNPLLTHRRHLFERVRTFWAEKRGVWCAVDFESWERDHTVLTEFGWSLLGWKDGTKVEECGHLIVEEAKRYTNSQYVPDFRYVSLYRNFSSSLLDVGLLRTITLGQAR